MGGNVKGEHESQRADLSGLTWESLIGSVECHDVPARVELARRLKAMEITCGIKTFRNIEVPLDPDPWQAMDSLQTRNRDLIGENSRLRQALEHLASQAESYMKYHADKFYGGEQNALSGLTPAICAARSAARKGL